MDLQQRKLTRDEWNSIEKPVSTQEKQILKLIKDGFHNVNISMNYSTTSFINHLKVNHSDIMDLFIFVHYLQNDITNIIKHININYKEKKEGKQKLNKTDKLRIANTDKNIKVYKETIFEFILIDILEKMVQEFNKKYNKWLEYYYTLHTLITYNIQGLNNNFKETIQYILNFFEKNYVDVKEMLYRGQDIIEKNKYLLKYADIQLHEHQKKIFTTVKQTSNPQLILYIAPTGTGKTLTPIGLAEGYKVIFVCAARHVGLALAKSAISSGRKVAFAFGCNDAEDIRLHYYAVTEYTKNYKSGGIGKVDNTIGDKVEIIISDIKSYIPAMYYMLAFNDASNIITYWDEPTITMDYDEHEFHSIIQTNWTKNVIPKVVLSSATLPQEDEILPTIQDFRSRFDNAEIISIISHDCKKTIPLINKNGYVEMPHYLHNDYSQILECVKHCKKYKTLLRYIDLQGCIQFIKFVNENYKDSITNERYYVEEQIPTIKQINMFNIKTYYLDLLAHINKENWSMIYNKLLENRNKIFKSTIQLVTNDAYTLTDGPTIFLADNVDKIAKFCIQNASIPSVVASDIKKSIQYNSVINEKVALLEKALEDKQSADEKKDKKMMDENRGDPETKRLRKEIEKLQSCVKSIALNPLFVPNTKEHLKRFDIPLEYHKNVFKCDISDLIVEKIMLIDDIEDSWKLLLLMGIGVFTEHKSVRYAEVMKQLAIEQKLFIIIASSDFIYGTNYQFCHGYISKDLNGMSQEKAIQAMGRVGRNKIQQSYSIRFRDDDIIMKLFTKAENKPEVKNMAKLFNSI